MTKEKKKKMDWLFTGKLEYRLTNDFMFKAVLQENETALRGLLCALLGMEAERIKTVRVMNPIEIGKKVEDKLMMLDLKLEMNDDCIMDIEMQILDKGNWPVRSLAYLSRSFDQLEKGDSYEKVKETIHIGILDFTPEGFPDRLYLDYYFYNLDTAHKYSDKMSIRVLELNQLDRVADDQKKSNLYYWASFFKAKTWEEMWMLAEKDETIRECVFTYKELTADEKARMQSEAREDYYRRLNWAEKRGLNRGMEEGLVRGQKETARTLVSSVDHAMESFQVGLERACEGLGTTVEAYKAAQALME